MKFIYSRRRIALPCAVAVVWLASVASAADLAVLRNGFTIRHDHHKVMGETTRLFLSADDSSFTDVATADIASFEKDLTPPPPEMPAAAPVSTAGAPAAFSAGSALAPAAARPAVDLNEVVNSASATYHLDPDLVNSVIHAESGFNVRARSPKGAQGLMQLMPETANALGVNNAFDPLENVGGGSHYLRELLERYNFDLVKALAAYNAGPDRVEQYQGVPPFHETRAYVAHIIHEYNQKKIAQERAEARAKKQAAAQNAKTGTTKPGTKSAATNKHVANAGSQVASSSASANSPANAPR